MAARTNFALREIMSDVTTHIEEHADTPPGYPPMGEFSPRHLKIIVVTPEATVLETMADFVALPLYDGELGVAPLHSPMIGRLGYGEMRVRNNGATDRYFIDGGFVQVADNVVSVLTNRAVPAAQIDAAEAAAQLEAARKMPSNTPELMSIRDREELQARARLRVATRK